MIIQSLWKKLSTHFGIVPKRYQQDAKAAAILYLDGLADASKVTCDLIQLLSRYLGPESTPENFKNTILGYQTLSWNMPEIVNAVTAGAIILIFSHIELAITSAATINIQPDFGNSLLVNLALIRNRIRSAHLKCQYFGQKILPSRNIGITYLEGAVNPQQLENLQSKIAGLPKRAFWDPRQIQQAVKEIPWSFFPEYQVVQTIGQAIESLFSGKMLIMLGGSPTILSGPIDFFTFFKSPVETEWRLRSFMAIIRVLAVVTAVFLPAIYIAIVTFHYYFVPVSFLIQLAELRSKSPLTPLLEVVFIETVFEIFREIMNCSSLPGKTAIGISGMILFGLGIAATGLVTEVLIVLSAISFLFSQLASADDYGYSFRVLKFGALVPAAAFGILGLAVFGSLTFAHLLTHESLGQPYFLARSLFQNDLAYARTQNSGNSAEDQLK
jgi:spore germination protein